MGTVEDHDQYVYPNANTEQCKSRVAVPPPQPFLKSLQGNLKETFFPDDPLRQFKNQPKSRKFMLGLQYFFPVLEWAPKYKLEFLKSDLIAGITIASLAIPQGISYAKLANLPPILGLYSSFVPPLVYALMGTSKDVAVGTIAVGSLLTGTMLSSAVDPNENPKLFLHLAFTATLVAGIFEATLGLLRKYRFSGVFSGEPSDEDQATSTDSDDIKCNPLPFLDPDFQTWNTYHSARFI